MRNSKQSDQDIQVLRKEVAALERLERRGGMTLVVRENVLITAYHVSKGAQR